tara:strand:+ start:3836 stop:5047 length:1212 start_codon:yes stop_codon:yes gene_type:complete
MVACGGDTEVMSADAGPDASSGTRGSVSVHLGPSGGDTYVFSSMPNGEFIYATRTDENGDALLLAEETGMISIVNFGYQLTTYTGIALDSDIRWEPPSFDVAEEVVIAMQAFEGATSYSVFSCEDQYTLYQEVEPVTLTLTESCANSAMVGVLAIASDNDGPIAYGHVEVATEAALAGPIDISWQEGLELLDIDYEMPSELERIQGGGVFEFPGVRVAMPSSLLVFGEEALVKPPGDSEHLWTELTRYEMTSGWQSHDGALPEPESAWMSPPTALTITHTAEQNPIVAWEPSTDEMDVVIGEYYWEAGPNFGAWFFVANPTASGIVFPEMPPGVPSLPALGLEPEGFLYLSNIDHDDTESFASALSQGSAPRTLTNADQDFLAEGGTIRSATVYVSPLPADAR